MLGQPSRSLVVLMFHASVLLAAPVDGCAARLHEGRDPSRLAAVGRAHLKLADLDGAIDSLGAAAALAPRDASLKSDLAAALLARSERRSHSDDVLAAVDAADAALEIEPGRDAARVVLTAGLERLGLTSLGGPADSRDAEQGRFLEAIRQRDASTADALVAGDQDGFREWLERELLAAWADAQLAGDTERESSALATSGEVASRLSEASGDRLLEETIGGILKARVAGDRRRLASLAQGFRHYRDGRARADVFDMEAAGAAMEYARVALENEASPLALQAEFHLAVRDFYAEDRRAASARLRKLIAAAEEHGYRLLAAHSARTLGLIDAVESRFSSALARYREALSGYRAAGETDSALYTQTLLAECYLLLGDSLEEWRIREEMLPALSRMHDRQAQGQILFDTAINVLRLGHPRAALHFQDAALGSGAARDPAAWVWRTRLDMALGREADARRDLARAESEHATVRNGALDQRLDSEILLAKASLLVPSDAAQALDMLARAGRFFESAGLEARLPEIHLERARAALALGRDDDAEQQLRSGIESYERNRAAIEDDASRVSYFDRSGEVFDEMVSFQLDRRHDFDAAFSFAERARSRTLADRESVSRPRASPDDVARSLPTGTLVLDYVVLPERLVVWALAADGVRRVERHVSAEELGRLVSRLTEPIDEAAMERVSVTLGRLLLEPFARDIARATTVALVLDKALHRVPFAMLRMSPDGPRLVEKAAIVIVPRADLVMAQHATIPTRPQDSCRVLVVGEPKVDERALSRLPGLPGARLEAEVVRLSWAGAELLAGEAATKTRFLEKLTVSDVIHFAGHAVVREERPALSFLAFAPDPTTDDTGALYARDLEKLRLPREPLVVLSACDTAAGPLSRSEGALSLARPFLAAGASHVVASLWPIDDAASSRFFAEFHRRLRDGLCPVAALRATQLVFLHHPDSTLRAPRAWAAFTIYGPAGDQTLEGGSSCPFPSSCTSAGSARLP